MAGIDDNLRKVPPQNLEAESSVLGGILLENEAVNQVLELLRPEDFYRESHRKVFRAIVELSDRSEPVDLITLSDCLKSRGEIEAVGGTAYLASLADFVPTAHRAREIDPAQSNNHRDRNRHPGLRRAGQR
jgi:replicative DNA helicase